MATPLSENDVQLLSDAESEQYIKGPDGYTNHDMLKRFQKFTKPDVKKFGLELGVGNVDIDIIISRMGSESTPQLQALEVYDHWNKATDRDDKEEILANAFKNCGHGRVAGRLTNRDRRVQTNEKLSGFNVYHQLQDKIKTDEDARLFGLNLGLDHQIIEEILDTEDYSVVKAHTMFVKWKSNCDPNEITDSVMISRVTESISAVTRRRSTEEAAISTRSGKPPPVIALDNSPQENQDQEVIHDDVVEGTPLIRKNNKSNLAKKSQLFCKVFWIIFSIVLAVEIVLVILIYAYKREDMIIVLPDDTISIPLPSYTPYELELNLWGKHEPCHLTIIKVSCDDIQTGTSVINGQYYINYQYLAEGSSITIDAHSIPDYLKPYYIWLFDNIEDANTAVSERFQRDNGYLCEEPHRGSECQIVYPGNHQVVFKIEKSSYYFLRCEEGSSYNCSYLSHWSINEVTYNFTEVDKDAIAKVAIYTQNKTTHFRLRPTFFPSSIGDICLLGELDTVSCGAHEELYFMTIEYVEIFLEWAMYGALVNLFLLIVGTLVIYCIASKFL